MSALRRASLLWLWLWLLPLAATAPRAESPASVPAPVRVAYHFDSGLEQAARGLRNIRNHLAADPSARITAVALSDGIDFLLKGAKSAGGHPFDALVEELQFQGVRFKACNNTLKARGLDKAALIEDVEIVPSGVAELARLQSREQHAYVKP